MAITGRAPTEVVLGVAPGAAALTVGGALRRRAGGEDGPWGALAIHGCLADAGLRPSTSSRWRSRRAARTAWACAAAGSRPRRGTCLAPTPPSSARASWERGCPGRATSSERLSRHAAPLPGRRRRLYLRRACGRRRRGAGRRGAGAPGASGKILDPDLPAGPVTAGQIATWRAALRAEPVVYVADHDRPCPLEEIATAPVWGAQALAAGAALARADERQSMGPRALDPVPEPTLTVVVPVFSGAATLPRCLSALAEALPAGAAVIVVDDGSTGETALAEDLPAAVLPDQRGTSAARNTGWRAAAALVAFVDADMVIGRRPARARRCPGGAPGLDEQDNLPRPDPHLPDRAR